jgi:hypothetical protein
MTIYNNTNSTKLLNKLPIILIILTIIILVKFKGYHIITKA